MLAYKIIYSFNILRSHADVQNITERAQNWTFHDEFGDYRMIDLENVSPILASDAIIARQTKCNVKNARARIVRFRLRSLLNTLSALNTFSPSFRKRRTYRRGRAPGTLTKLDGLKKSEYPSASTNIIFKLLMFCRINGGGLIKMFFQYS